MKKRESKTYTEDFIRDAVQLYKDSGETYTAIGARLGVPDSTLRAWYERSVGKKKGWTKPLARGNEVPSEETVEQKLARLERENVELRRKVDRLETDKVILKKAAAFFARESE
jgi:transposase